ncbi:MAG: proton-conducting transporter membrane subunit [bacterium]|nr:proton-conducting transporter membrane subunit [bacterium]
MVPVHQNVIFCCLGMSESICTQTIRRSLIAFPFVVFGLLFALLIGVQPELPLDFAATWVPALGVQLAWRIDGLTLLMLFMITGVGAAVFVYANGYMRAKPERLRLLAMLALFMVAMVICVCADDLIVLFLGWEATSILSFLLVGLEHENKNARQSAQQALLITGGGGLLLLAGFLLLAQQGGTFSLSALIRQAPELPRTPELRAAICLIILGAFTKSAQFPFHFWLPNAMAAPTPVSAYLHSATMVKLGVYLLARLDAGFDGSREWQLTLETIGSITAAWGMVLALKERDLKRILAWSTVATLGTLITFIGLSGQYAALAVAALLLTHALYKAPLFFVAGNIDKGVGTRIIDHLSGLGRVMPWTAAAALFAGISMAGLPFSFGYVSKELLALAKENAAELAFVPMANLIFSAIAVGVATVAAIRLFWTYPLKTGEANQVREGSFSLVAPPLLLAGGGMVFGIFPQLLQPLLNAAVLAMLPQERAAHFSLQPATSVDPSLLMAVFGLGTAFFFFWDFLHCIVDALVNPVLKRFGASSWYGRGLRAIPHIAASFTRRTQHGLLPRYLIVIVLFCTLVPAFFLWQARYFMQLPAFSLQGSEWFAWAAVLLIGVGASFAALVKERLTMVLASTLVGYGSALLFLFAGAPDVALTQFVVDTVFVIIVAAVLLILTKMSRAMVSDPGWRPGSLVIALGFSTVITLLLLVALAFPFTTDLSDWFGRESVPRAHGRNVVNVILVDFRAFDTLGEITVVLISFMAALAVLHKKSESIPAALAAEQGGFSSVPVYIVMAVAARYLYPLMIAVSLWMLIRGHNEPGGGFIGGLTATTASVLWAITRGASAAQIRMPLKAPLILAASGLLLAAFSGLPGWWAGQTFLSHQWFEFSLGQMVLPLSTTLLFDLGVYLCVWGALGGYALHLLARGSKQTSAPLEERIL